MARGFDETKVRRWPGGSDRGGQFREQAGGGWLGRISDQVGHRLTMQRTGAVVGSDRTWLEQVTHNTGAEYRQANLVHSNLAANRKVAAPPPPVDYLMRHLAGQESANLANLQLRGDGNQNLFRKHIREIPRSQMPQLPEKADDLQA